MNEHEKQTISAFILKEKRPRYRLILDDPQRRASGLDRLNHCRDLDPKYVTWLRSNAAVVELLREAGSPETVYVISSTAAIDGQLLPLQAAVEGASLGGWGTIISCVPGRLAYYYDEVGERRALLQRNAKAR